MLISGTNLRELTGALMLVNKRYSGNVTTTNGFNRTSEKGSRYRFALRAVSSRGPGARRAASGRRTVAVCYHVFRDFMKHILFFNPNARIKTAMNVYRGADDFLAKYEAVADNNCGSAFNPVCYGDTCECEHSELAHDIYHLRATGQF